MNIVYMLLGVEILIVLLVSYYLMKKINFSYFRKKQRDQFPWKNKMKKGM